MSLLSRLLSPRGDEYAPIRPLWDRVVAVARDPAWYATARVADTVSGRFDAVTLVLALVLLRMEHGDLARASVLLTEIFVTDMDGQLRESGVGDLMVGKRVGQLMGVLGGRLGAYRMALADADRAALIGAIARNVGFGAAADPALAQGVAAGMARDLAARLATVADAALLAGEWA